MNTCAVSRCVRGSRPRSFVPKTYLGTPHYTMEVTDPTIIRMVKGYDCLKTKITKLTDENARLKGQLVEARASQSRIRRIPKKGAPAATAAPETQTTA